MLFSQKLQVSKSQEKETHIRNVKKGIAALNKIPLIDENSEPNFLKIGKKELKQIFLDLDEIIRYYNQSFKKLTYEQSDFLVSLKICQRTIEEYESDAYWGGNYLKYDE